MLHVGGVQGTGHPAGLQPEKPGGNLTPAGEKQKRKVIFTHVKLRYLHVVHPLTRIVPTPV